MADYYSILKKTIASLPENNGAARRNVYSRARNAIVSQLKAYEPPLTPAEITAEQLRLEEAIRKVEAEAARETLMASRPSAPAVPEQAPVAPPMARAPEPAPMPTSGQAAVPPQVQPQSSGLTSAPSPASSPALSPAPSQRTPLGATLQEAERLGQASSRAVQTARDAFAPEAAPAAPVDPVLRREPSFGSEAAQPAAVRMPAPEAAAQPRPADPRFDRRPEPELPVDKPVAAQAAPSRKPPRARAADRGTGGTPITRYVFLGGLVVIIIGLAAVLFSQRDMVAGLFSGGSETAVSTEPAQPAASQDGAPATAENGRVEKTNDRLLTDSGEPAVAPDARTVTTTLITPSQPAPQPAATAPAAPAPVAPAVTAPAPATEVPAESIVAQRSILYEEGEDASGSGTASQGRVAWSVVEETDNSGKKVQVLAAQAEIPDRNITVSVRIKPNTDASLPASHLVEIQYQLPEGFSGKDVANVPGLVMKPTEEARGDALLGASVKVAPGYFWIALSSIDNERDRNLALMRERGWIDIPMLYETGKRAILTLEKGTPGARALEQAMASWTNG
ncbi:hypothetical protein [Pannonibacter tanglangensis]|uniref:CheA signal transduction histidine kinase n=1 Tax=Pannonibacter tanglangensis TaxID=2750084 RepID=A0ABW9ZJZ7_9HYPH|nr:hypothetical protein [Pannonibacter sp. XCT-34]NBN65228.1 hypothetical protein [Pannonibacter sp. XCT-34]